MVEKIEEDKLPKEMAEDANRIYDEMVEKEDNKSLIADVDKIYAMFMAMGFDIDNEKMLHELLQKVDP